MYLFVISTYPGIPRQAKMHLFAISHLFRHSRIGQNAPFTTFPPTPAHLGRPKYTFYHFPTYPGTPRQAKILLFCFFEDVKKISGLFFEMSNELNKDFSQNLFFSPTLSYLMTSGNASQTTTKNPASTQLSASRIPYSPNNFFAFVLVMSTTSS